MSDLMGSDVFLNSLNLPANCKIGSTVFKKLFYDTGLSVADKKLITNQVDKVIIHYNLNPEKINIQPFFDEEREYSEVQVIEARLNNNSRHKRIAEIIMRAIPYPTILQLTYGTSLMVAAGMPRINLADRQKHTIQEFVFSPWMDSERLSPQDRDFLASIQAGKLSFTNFYRFYSDFVDQLHLYKAAKLAGETLKNQDPQEAKRLHTEVIAIESELVALRSQLKKESMFNRKVELNVEIKRLAARKQEIIEAVKNPLVEN
jgi:hypothetical protein